MGENEFAPLGSVDCQIGKHGRRVYEELFACWDTDLDSSVRAKERPVKEHLPALATGETEHARGCAGAFKGIEPVAVQSGLGQIASLNGFTRHALHQVAVN